METKSNRLWTELCKDIPYDPAYAISHLLDPSVFHFISRPQDDFKKITFFLIYDAANENKRILIFDNGMGYTKAEIQDFNNYETIAAKGWKQWFRALQWLGNNTKIYNQKKDEQTGTIISFETKRNHFSQLSQSQCPSNEFYSRTKFNHGVLLQINEAKTWTLKEFQNIVNTVNKIYQKYVNLDKINFHAIYRMENKFYDCSTSEPVEIVSYRKAEPFKPIKKPELFQFNKNQKQVIINEKIDFENRTISIKGIAGILKNPDYETAGIYCYSGNKLVLGAKPNSNFKPAPIFGSNEDVEYSSLYSELEFSNLPVAITGDKFQISAENWNRITLLLTKIIGKQGDFKTPDKLTTQVNTVYQSTNVLPIATVEQYSTVSENIIDALRSTNAIIDVQMETVKKNKREANLYSIKDEYGKEYKIQLIRASNREASGYWIKKKYVDDSIVVYFNFEHPFFRPIISNKRSYNTFCEFVIYYVIAEERAIVEGCSVEELKLLIDNYLRKGN
ncbi:hypothetical protein [[Mycoplasma] testudinis]|uniref:hypothetical protein n=1 Tax=[Mycoplasma] testudinis TaxID=33924 RepID=UPI00047F4EE8|nr:hypothetical protein [[Mycoplasma] testudinis]